MAAISGYDGNITGNGIVGALNTWSATLSRAVSDVTGFTNSGRNRVLGLYDLTGSAGGVVDNTATIANTTTGIFTCFATATGTTITLQVETGNTIAANCVVDSVAFGVSKAGDATVTFNFSLASTTTGTTSPFTVAWS